MDEIRWFLAQRPSRSRASRCSRAGCRRGARRDSTRSMRFGPSRRLRKTDHGHSLFLTNVQIHPAKVRTTNGYPTDGSGAEVGNNGAPQKILAAVTPKSTAPTAPATRIQVANVLGMLVSSSDADHKATPPPKDGTLPARPAAVPDRRRLSPATNTRKPAATQSSPFL